MHRVLWITIREMITEGVASIHVDHSLVVVWKVESYEDINLSRTMVGSVKCFQWCALLIRPGNYKALCETTTDKKDFKTSPAADNFFI